jgi:gamma-glutamyltranspeptidase/glutathione hydrolase
MAAIAAAYPETRAVFLPDGRPPGAEFNLRQPDMARTLRTIQAEGAAVFYRGSIAQALVARGWTVLEQPPVSPGCSS